MNRSQAIAIFILGVFTWGLGFSVGLVYSGGADRLRLDHLQRLYDATIKSYAEDTAELEFYRRKTGYRYFPETKALDRKTFGSTTYYTIQVDDEIFTRFVDAQDGKDAIIKQKQVGTQKFVDDKK